MITGLKVYIQDSNNKYVDFTNMLVYNDRLSSLGSVSHATEQKAFSSSFMSSLSQVILDNSDGFWDDPDQWSSTLNTEEGNTAVFTTSSNSREIVLLNSKCKVKAEVLQKDGTVKEHSIGVFYISDYSTDNNTGQATLHLLSLSAPLKKISANTVKYGRDWYENRDVIFLIKELLKTKYADSSNELPAYFSFPNRLEIKTFDDTRVLSSFGRPPERVTGTQYIAIIYYSYSSAYSSAYNIQES